MGSGGTERQSLPGLAMLPALAHIDTWIFDLDNTLYPASANLFERIDARMTAYVGRLLDLPPLEALRVQKRYFHDHGTTLAGLMANHGVDPHHFLADVHAIEMDVLEENAPLAAAIAKLPGRKLVFTNGDAPYASRVLERLGLDESFEAIHDVHAMDLKPKPEPSAYAGLCAAFGIDRFAGDPELLGYGIDEFAFIHDTKHAPPGDRRGRRCVVSG